MRLPWMAGLLPCAVLLLAAAGQAQAGVIFDGQTIGYQYLFPSQGNVYFEEDMTVGIGAEKSYLYNGGAYAFLDVSDTNLQVDYYGFVQWTNAAFNGLRIFDKYNVLPAFTSATVDASTNLSGFSQSNVSFDANNIFVNWQGLSGNPDTLVSINVSAAPSFGPGAPGAGLNAVVPEPASVVIFGVGGIGLMAGARRRRKRQARKL